MVALMPPPDSYNWPLYGSRYPWKSGAFVITDRPGMFTCPGDLRPGKVSLRFSCAVKPPAAHTATPRVPLPSGIDWVAAVFARPSTMSDCRTTLATSTPKAPPCHAVVTVAAWELVLLPKETNDTPSASTPTEAKRARLRMTASP